MRKIYAAFFVTLSLVILAVGSIGYLHGKHVADRWWKARPISVPVCSGSEISTIPYWNATGSLAVTPTVGESKSFDVPPKRWTTKYEIASEPIECDPPLPKNSTIGCGKPIYEYIDHIACTDKSRFLLEDESGKYHCLALTEEK